MLPEYVRVSRETLFPDSCSFKADAFEYHSNSDEISSNLVAAFS